MNGGSLIETACYFIMPRATRAGHFAVGGSYPHSIPSPLDNEIALYILLRTTQCLLLDELQSGEPDVQGILPVCKTRFEKSGFFVSAGMNEQSFVPVGTEKEIRPNPPQADGHSRTIDSLTSTNAKHWVTNNPQPTTNHRRAIFGVVVGGRWSVVSYRSEAEVNPSRSAFMNSFIGCSGQPDLSEI